VEGATGSSAAEGVAGAEALQVRLFFFLRKLIQRCNSTGLGST